MFLITQQFPSYIFSQLTTGIEQGELLQAGGKSILHLLQNEVDCYKKTAPIRSALKDDFTLKRFLELLSLSAQAQIAQTE